MPLFSPKAERVTPRVSPLQAASADRRASAAHDHRVQFYERDDFLVEAVGRYLAGGFDEGAAAMVIATDEHLLALAEYFRRAGLSLAALIDEGAYVALNARETLNLFMVDGRPDAERFEQAIGALITKLSAGQRPIRAFGEMVALLWDDGKAEAAIELEELWNLLALRLSFGLFCAYPMKAFSSAEARQPFLHICQAHSRVLPVESFRGSYADDDGQSRAVALLQQKAASLEREVVERKRAETRLRRREAELTALIENTSLGLHWVNEQGIIIWANAAELALLGYTGEEYVGREIRDCHVDQVAIDDIMFRLQRGERLQGREARLRCKDGTIKTVLIDSNVLWDEGKFVHTQCFTRDVTAERAAEEIKHHLAAIVASSDRAGASRSGVSARHPAARGLAGEPLAARDRQGAGPVGDAVGWSATGSLRAD